MGGYLRDREEGVRLCGHVLLNSIRPVGFRPAQRGPGGGVGVKVPDE